LFNKRLDLDDHDLVVMGDGVSGIDVNEYSVVGEEGGAYIIERKEL
jgi:hypothetical protein